MELALGTDIIAVKRIAALLKRWPRKFSQRLFTEAECSYCWSRKNSPEHFAARFAAKEALIKALRVKNSQRINMREIEVKKDSNGAPFIELSGELSQIAARGEIARISLSMSHCREYATATVILRKE